MSVKVPGGGARRDTESLPQHATLPSARRPQAWLDELEMRSNGPAGIVPRTSGVQLTAPAMSSVQRVALPTTTCLKVPSTRFELAREPQHSTCPSTASAHPYWSSTLTSVNWPAGGSLR